MAVRRDQIVLHTGGRPLDRYGTFIKRTAIWEELVETHERASTAASKGRDGVLRSAENNVPRPHWVTDHNGILAPSYLLEGAGTNELTRSEELDHADWSKSSASVTADQATGPDGATLLDEIVEGGTTSEHRVEQTATLTADAIYALSAFAKANTRSWISLRLINGSNFCRAWFNLTDGSVGTTDAGGTGALTRAYVEDWTEVAAGLYRVVLVGSVGSSATSIAGRINIASQDGTTGYNGDNSSSLYAGYAQLEDDSSFASSYVATTTAAASRDADLLQESDVGFTPADIEAAGGLTVLSEWVELGTAFSGFERYWHVGGPAGGGSPRLFVESDGNDGTVEAGLHDGSAHVSELTSAVSLLDHVRARVVIFLDGSTWKIQLHVSVNGGAETSAPAATIGSSLPSAWSADTLTIGAAPDDILHGFAAHIEHLFVLGEHTLAEMEAVQ